METHLVGRDEALKIYEQDGAVAASQAAGVSTRTIQRWANAEGLTSGWEPSPTKGHGTAACYIRGCRLPECVEANRQTNREVKERRVKRFEAGQVTLDHGKVTSYVNWQCRCQECKSAWSAYLRNRRNHGKE